MVEIACAITGTALEGVGRILHERKRHEREARLKRNIRKQRANDEHEHNDRWARDLRERRMGKDPLYEEHVSFSVTRNDLSQCYVRGELCQSASPRTRPAFFYDVKLSILTKLNRMNSGFVH